MGAVLCILGVIEDYKKMADANPDPKIVYDARHFLHKEGINLARLIIGGIALVLFMPMLVGGTTVDIKNASGNVVTTLKMATVLMPMYFFVGYSGVNGLLAIFGKYKNTFMKQVGVDDK